MTSHSFPDISLDRLLRPLRNKCRCLAKISNMHKSRHSMAQYYSSGSTQYTTGTWNDRLQGDASPLFILPCPTQSRHGTQNKELLATINLARAIYDVQNAFDDLLSKTNLNSTTEEHTRVLSLSSICAVILGQQIYHAQQGNEDTHDDELSGEEIYDSIPKSSRRPAVLSLATDMILGNCPHIPTLLMVLMESSLRHHEQHSAETFLHALMIAATTTPSNSRIPKLCHKDHASFLTTTCTKWADAGMSQESFIRILSQVLFEAKLLIILGSSALERFIMDMLPECCDLLILHMFVPITRLFKSWLQEACIPWDLPRPTKRAATTPSANDTLAHLIKEWTHGLVVHVIEHGPVDDSHRSSCMEDLALELYAASKRCLSGALYDEVGYLVATCAAYLPSTVFRDLAAKIDFSPSTFKPLLSGISFRKERRLTNILTCCSRHRSIIAALATSLEENKLIAPLSVLWVSALRFFRGLQREYPGDEGLIGYIKELEAKVALLSGEKRSCLEVQGEVWPDGKKMSQVQVSSDAARYKASSRPRTQSMTFISRLHGAMANKSAVQREDSMSPISRKRRRVTRPVSYAESGKGSDSEVESRFMQSSDDPLDII